jgi:hypothetical protein
LIVQLHVHPIAFQLDRGQHTIHLSLTYPAMPLRHLLWTEA